jgi:hypothetical protein
MIQKSLNLIDGATVFSDVYLDHEKNKNNYVSIIKDNISSYDSYNECVKCKMTNWNLFDRYEFEELRNWIKYTVNKCARSLYLYAEDLEIKEAWGLIYSKGDFAKSHTHFPYLFSFTYFLNTNHNHPPLVFDKIFPDSIQIKPSEGLLVIFPSYVNHFVPKSEINNERIVISGNLK